MKFVNEQPGIWCINKGWKFIEGDMDVLPEGRTHDDIYAFAKGNGAKGPAELSYDDSGWQDVELPHDWVTGKDFTEKAALNHGYKERGCGWYRFKFNLPEEDRKKRISLQFEGVSRKAEIYINGLLCRRQFYGYNSFSVDITDFVCFTPSVNQLAVRIDASDWEGWWYEGAGIYRNVWMVKQDPIHIAYQGVYAKTMHLGGNEWELSVETTVENSFAEAGEAKIEYILYDNGRIIAEFSSETEARIDGFDQAVVCGSTRVKEITAWDTEQPKLYDLRVNCISGNSMDHKNIRIGFRTVELSAEEGFLLNGRRVKLKGVCCHQDHAGVGTAVPYAVKEYRIGLLKEMGANAYRPAHHPDPEILDICDRMGMLVMQENRTFSSDAATLEELRGIARGTRNHPGAVMYSIFNEEPLQGTERGARMAARMRTLIHKMDDSRPVLGAFNGGYLDESGAVTSLDAVGINYSTVWYDEFHKKFPEIPLVASETASACMVRGEYRSDADKHLIESYDTFCVAWGNTHRDAWKMTEERKFVAGAFVWTGFDYRGEPTPFQWPSVASFFGIYDSCGFTKEAVYLYKAMWKKEPVVHLISPWAGKHEEGEMIRTQIVSNCEEVELRIGGKVKMRLSGGVYEQEPFLLPYEKETLEAVGYIAGEERAREYVACTGRAVRLKIILHKNTLVNDGLDTAVVNVCAVDKDGNADVDAEDMIFIETGENARILGCGNGNPNSHEPDCAPYRKLFHGWAQFIIRAECSGNFRIRVRAEELKPAEAVITVCEKEHIPFLEPARISTVEGWKMYSRVLDEDPQGEIESESNDQNSYEPVEFHGRPQGILTGKEGKYAVYRCEIDIKGEKETYLLFQEIKGQAWIYYNDVLACSRTEESEGAVKAAVPSEMRGKIICTVVVRNQDTSNGEAGICGSVIMQEK